MEDVRSIITQHQSRKQPFDTGSEKNFQPVVPSTSEIPDLFFDEILMDYKLTRMEITVLMFLYRTVWCKPNLYRSFGISNVLSYAELCQILRISLEELHQSLVKLESFGFIETLRAGQFFVRKYFTRDRDERYGQFYDDLE